MNILKEEFGITRNLPLNAKFKAIVSKDTTASSEDLTVSIDSSKMIVDEEKKSLKM